MPEPKPNKTSIKIVPNIERVLVKLISQKDLINEVNILVPGQLKAGENLLYGEIVDGGNTKFKPGQRVYYSEYSASALFRIGSVDRGELTLGQAGHEENKLYVVAEDDVMAYETEGEQYVPKSKIMKKTSDAKPGGIIV